MQTGSIPAGRYGGQTLTVTQVSNVARVFQVGRRMGANDRDLITAAITTRVESNHYNVTGGDRDSAGIFQQRPSAGWGTYAQVTNIEYASEKFFSALFKVPNRSGISPGAAAQAVQRSAFPGRYDLYLIQGQELVSAFKGGASLDGTIGGGNATLPIGMPDIPNPLEPLQKAAGAILNPHTWLRIGMFLFGGILVMVALWKISGQDQQAAAIAKAFIGSKVKA